MHYSLSRLWGVAVLALLAMAVGCGSNEKKAALEQSNLKPLMIFCGQFTGQNGGKPPANDGELKAFIQAKGPEALKAFNVTNVDALFISPRDNQPYVILYEKLGGAPGGVPGMPTPGGSAPGTPGSSGGGASALGGQPVVAYEAAGVEGKRLVASAVGAVEEVDEKKFRELVPSAK